MHPYMARAIAEERVNEFIRVAEEYHRTRDGAEPGTRRRRGSRRWRSADRQLSHTRAPLVAAHADPADHDHDQERSPELCEAGC